MSAFDRELAATASALVSPGKGLLAMDESNSTCARRFEKLGIPVTAERRRAYRELIITTPSLLSLLAGRFYTMRRSAKLRPQASH